MDKKITGAQAAKLLAIKTGKPQSLCEALVKSLFARVGEGLKRDGIVKVKDFGTFKLTAVSARKSVDVNTGESNEIPSHMKVSFVPSKELAAAVNSPFDMFTTLELTEDVLDEELMQAEATSAASGIGGTDIMADEIREQEVMEMRKAEEEHEEVENRAAEELAPVLAPPESSDLTDVANHSDLSEPIKAIEPDEPVKATEPAEVVGPAKPAEVAEPTEISAVAGSAEIAEPAESAGSIKLTDSSEPADRLESKVVIERRSGFGRGFIWGISVGLLLLLVAVGVIRWLGIMGQSGDHGGKIAKTAVVSDSLSDKESVASMSAQDDVMSAEDAGVDEAEADVVAPTLPSDDVPVYDTISHTRYLTTMARDHYGNYHLWPYIYEENKSILGHPDRIRPGTRVVIPDLSKYGVDPKNPEDISEAKKKGAAIYARYK